MINFCFHWLDFISFLVAKNKKSFDLIFVSEKDTTSLMAGKIRKLQGGKDTMKMRNILSPTASVFTLGDSQ